MPKRPKRCKDRVPQRNSVLLRPETATLYEGDRDMIRASLKNGPLEVTSIPKKQIHGRPYGCFNNEQWTNWDSQRPFGNILQVWNFAKKGPIVFAYQIGWKPHVVPDWNSLIICHYGGQIWTSPLSFYPTFWCEQNKVRFHLFCFEEKWILQS